jgi:hypothetical protein
VAKQDQVCAWGEFYNPRFSPLDALPVLDFLRENWMLVLLAVASGAMLLRPSLAGFGGGKISAAEAVRLINREKGVLIDVCEPAEYAAGHPVGAKNVPWAASTAPRACRRTRRCR